MSFTKHDDEGMPQCVLTCPQEARGQCSRHPPSSSCTGGRRCSRRSCPGGNGIQIVFPGKSIFRDYFRQNGTSRRHENQFSGKIYFHAIHPRVALQDPSSPMSWVISWLMASFTNLPLSTSTRDLRLWLKMSRLLE